jgi:hypothetical protein
MDECHLIMMDNVTIGENMMMGPIYIATVIALY